jgi:hypothetical protein
VTTDDDYTIDLGRRLLAAGLTGDQDTLSRLLVDLTDHTGDRAVCARLAAAWIRAALEYLGVAAGTVVQLGELSTGKVADLDDVSAELSWATRAVAARAAGDEAEWLTLMCGLPLDDNAARIHMGALLNLLGLALRQARTERENSARSADVQAAPVSATWTGRAAGLRGHAALN